MQTCKLESSELPREAPALLPSKDACVGEGAGGGTDTGTDGAGLGGGPHADVDADAAGPSPGNRDGAMLLKPFDAWVLGACTCKMIHDIIMGMTAQRAPMHTRLGAPCLAQYQLPSLLPTSSATPQSSSNFLDASRQAQRFNKLHAGRTWAS